MGPMHPYMQGIPKPSQNLAWSYGSFGPMIAAVGIALPVHSVTVLIVLLTVLVPVSNLTTASIVLTDG